MFELKVTLDNLLTFVGLMFVAWQMYDSNRQRKLETQIRLYDINRELITLGFSNPELFDVLKGGNNGKKVDRTIEARYLQLWLNQLSLVHSFKQIGAFRSDVQESFEADLRDIVKMPNMRRHWHEVQKYYPASFRKDVNHILAEAGPNKGRSATK